MKSLRNSLLKIGIFVIMLILIMYSVIHFIVLKNIDSNNNSVPGHTNVTVKTKILKLHHEAFVADLHADPLLWGRNLKQRNEYGHIDLPRLREGGVDLQVFGVVTKVPKVRNYTSTQDKSDILPVIFFASWRSPTTWFSPKLRALTQAKELRVLAEEDEIVLVLTKQDLSREGLKGLLSLEGMHALEGGDDDLEQFYQAGFRMMGLTHHFDNQVSGSSHGVNKGGLTDLGRTLIPKMESLGITIDLAHASSNTFYEVLDLATKPVVVSHGGVKGTCPGNRNLSDEQIRAVAQNGGVIGIGYWEGAVCTANVEGIVQAILYTIKVAGLNHVGLGSDFDGNVAAPFDTTGLPLITEALLAHGLSPEQVKKILGENVLRVLSLNLPD